jgi:LysM repeat protein
VQYDTSLDALIALNPDKCGAGGIIRPSDLLLVPAATLVPGPTPTLGAGTPSPTPECPILHVVKSGETGLGIAEQYGQSFNVLREANPQVNFDQLPINQVLQVPCPEAEPTATPTPDPNATPTPIPKYSAPALLAPPDGATLASEIVPLQWTAVSLLRDNEQYAVRLRRLDENVPVVSLYTRTTLVRLAEEYAPTLDDPVREYSWEVTVVREQDSDASDQARFTAASFTSVQRRFTWRLAPEVESLTPSPRP